MKMGEGEAFVAGLVVGGVGGAVGGGGLGFQAGYDKRDAELRPIIDSLQDQINAKSQRIAELEKQLNERTPIPVISQIRKKLGSSQS